MPFKEVRRVVYNKNPLAQVISQVRFPRILAINEKQPAEFQERLRQEYPLFDVSVEQLHRLTFDSAQSKLQDAPSDMINNYSFTSDDGKQIVNLASTFLSTATSNYTNWDNFFLQLKKPLQALNEIYKPVFFERVGLRYIDIFQRSILGLDNSQWDDLIEPFALCFLSNKNVKSDVVGYSSTSEIKLNNDANARIITALGYVGNNDHNEKNRELSFIVDTDLYFGKVDLQSVENALVELHGYSTKIIRSIIKEKLHKAMEPVENDTNT
ncbi:MAG: TIGR04255 family protein [Planctomycetaceae bacterium]|jgi:uncharacterized protein (TIGR04255 family)|nr:TIGR04255 family protein [Planctomycetaceae bacterium]